METQVIEVDPLVDGRKLFEQAARELEAGALVAIPTETVYGLGADGFNAEAVARIFDAKNRPHFDPLILHLSNGRQLSDVATVPAELNALVSSLIKQFWPGPMTLVLPKTDQVPDIVTSGLPTVAVRVSAHPVMRGVCRALGRPIAAPSANRFGRISPTSASAVKAELDGRIEFIMDAGACSEGLESTILRPCLDEKGKPCVELLREGPVTRDQLKKFTKILKRKKVAAGDLDESSPQAAPGQLPSHYAPSKPLQVVEMGEEFTPIAGVRYGLLSYEGDSDLAMGHDWVKMIAMSPGSGRLAEAAVRLFALMRQMDEDTDIDVIVAEAVSERGLGYAIMDRLRRASHQRTPAVDLTSKSNQNE